MGSERNTLKNGEVPAQLHGNIQHITSDPPFLDFADPAALWRLPLSTASAGARLYRGLLAEPMLAEETLNGTQGKAYPLPHFGLRLRALSLQAVGDDLWASSALGVARVREPREAGALPTVEWAAADDGSGPKTGTDIGSYQMNGTLSLGGKDKTLIVQSGSGEDHPRRFDPARQVWVPLLLPPSDPALPPIFAVTSAGVWIGRNPLSTFGGYRGYGGPESVEDDLRLLPLGEKGTFLPDIPLTPPDPTSRTPDEKGRYPFAYTAKRLTVTGAIVWYVGGRRRDTGSEGREVTVLCGFDTRRSRWTPALIVPDGSTLANSERDGGGIVEVNGHAYVALNKPEGSVWQYDPDRGEWQAVAPYLTPLPDEDINVRFWTHDAGGTFLLGGDSLWRWDGKTWLRYPLPPGQVEPLRPYQELNVPLAATARALYLGAYGGLWRWDRAARTWSLLRPTSGPNGQVGAEFWVRSIAADAETVFINGEVTGEDGARSEETLLLWDKSSERFRIADAASFPGRTENTLGRVFNDGAHVWYTGDDRAWRYDGQDEGKDRWTCIDGSTSGLDLKPGDRLTMPTFVADPFDPHAAYLLTRSVCYRFDPRQNGALRFTRFGDITALGDKGTGVLGVFPQNKRVLLALSAGWIAVDRQGRQTSVALPPVYGLAVRAVEGATTSAVLVDTNTVIVLP